MSQSEYLGICICSKSNAQISHNKISKIGINRISVCTENNFKIEDSEINDFRLLKSRK